MRTPETQDQVEINFLETADFFENLLRNYDNDFDIVILQKSEELKTHIMIISAALRIKIPNITINPTNDVYGLIGITPELDTLPLKNIVNKYLNSSETQFNEIIWRKGHLKEISNLLKKLQIMKEIKINTTTSFR